MEWLYTNWWIVNNGLARSETWKEYIMVWKFMIGKSGDKEYGWEFLNVKKKERERKEMFYFLFDGHHKVNSARDE